MNYRYLIKMPTQADLSPDTLAPLTDAGLTPYRGLKKLRAGGHLGPGRTLAVSGIGGLGSYGVQYAKLLGGARMSSHSPAATRSSRSRWTTAPTTQSTSVTAAPTKYARKSNLSPAERNWMR